MCAGRLNFQCGRPDRRWKCACADNAGAGVAC
jgi:hypothetical protein